jgi:hypothetical protein
MDYQQKYLKYKKKYLELKMRGGGGKFENYASAYTFITPLLKKNIQIYGITNYDSFYCNHRFRTHEDFTKCLQIKSNKILSKDDKKNWLNYHDHKMNFGQYYLSTFIYPITITI